MSAAVSLAPDLKDLSRSHDDASGVMVQSRDDSMLPDLKSSDNYIDKSKPLPTSLQSEFIPEEILNALTKIPKPVPKDGLPTALKTKNASTNKGNAPAANLWNFPSRRKKFQHLTDNPKSMTGAGRDISFLYDVPVVEPPLLKPDLTDQSTIRGLEKHKVRLNGGKGMMLPETLIPSEYHVVKSKGVQSLDFKDEKYTTHLIDKQEEPVSFPSMKPASRYEVLQLKETIRTMLEKAGVDDDEVEIKGPTQIHNLLELIKKEQSIYNVVFHELIRQVTVECAERGELLSELRQRYCTLLDKVPRQVKSLHQEVMAQRALDRRLTEELFRFKSSISDLTSELSDVRQHDKLVTKQSQQAQEDLARALKESEKNSSLLAEYHELYELQRKRLENQVASLAGERELWSHAAYNLALKVTEANALSTARRLHVSEKSWSKLAKHFAVVLSDRDTEQLSQLQGLIENHRTLTTEFDANLLIEEKKTCERLTLIKSGVNRWIADFSENVITLPGTTVFTDRSPRPSSRASEAMTVAKAPSKEVIRQLYEDLRHWEENLNKEVERFGGDVLLGHEESMYMISKQTEQWTEIAIKVFSRHKPDNGQEYPDHEKMLIMNKRTEDLKEECHQLMRQFQIKVNGENGTAKRLIHLTNSMESWDTKLNGILNGGAMPLNVEWARLYELFDDWLMIIEEAILCVGTIQTEEEANAKLKNMVEMKDVFKHAQKWLTVTTNGIDNEDAKLADQVADLHSSMIHWVIQVLLHLSPDLPGSPPEAVESGRETTDTIETIQQKASMLFDKLTRFSNYLTSCCSTIVAEELQKQQMMRTEAADHEMKDLKRIKTECVEWIHTATLIMNELRNFTPVSQNPPATQESLTASTDSRPSTTPVPQSPVKPVSVDPQGEKSKEASLVQQETSSPPNKEQSSPETSEESVTGPALPTGSSMSKLSEYDTSKMEVIGYDDNVRVQSLDEATEPPKESKAPSTVGTTRSATPDTSKAYEALAAVNSLQDQLLVTEERALKSENRVVQLEEELATALEKLRALERKSATPGQSEIGTPAPSAVENSQAQSSAPASAVPTSAQAQLPMHSPIPPTAPSPSTRRPGSQQRPPSQASNRSTSRGSTRSKKSK
ncbi:axonemal dynein light chain domain-containing protein 1-like isoform X2 [Anneissia japonica]|uniref:axonemal dynein light chain domain-containing protein 1-like isoform X2 n=1 Tax=Anneissia japonica TaxID=1529436 RepID=UPI001425584F|nr:axonemal dynein light chain domain-containing protein 1-like isoform X2 [Anneissia japonica]